jgi:hypothetical protein
MSPDDFIDQVGRLIETGHDQEALDFAARVGPAVKPALSFDQLDRVSGLLEGAAMATDMSRTVTAPEAVEVGLTVAAGDRGRLAGRRRRR